MLLKSVKILPALLLIIAGSNSFATEDATGFSNINDLADSAKVEANTKSAKKSTKGNKASPQDALFEEISNDPEVANDHKQAKTKQKDMPLQLQNYLAQKDDASVYKQDPSGKNERDPKKAQDTLRQTTIETTAVGFAAQAGLKWRYEQINHIIKTKYQGRLDEVNFRPFITDQNILTPSILILKDEEVYESPQRLVKSNIKFVVADEARIVSVPPTFRDYLIRNFPEPKKIHPALKPRDDQEQEAWKKGLLKGWDIGVKQANSIFQDGILRLERDIQGRVNYRKMIALKMISPAALKVTKRGVTFNDRTMNVGETVSEITNVANFTSLEEWRSAWLKSEEFGEAK